MVGVSSCVLLFVVKLVAVVVVVLLLCALRDARVVVPHRGSPGCTGSLSSLNLVVPPIEMVAPRCP